MITRMLDLIVPRTTTHLLERGEWLKGSTTSYRQTT
jgi:hypothetical protein